MRVEVFSPCIIEYLSNLLKEKEDENMIHYQADLSAHHRLLETNKIISCSIHRH